MVLIIGMLLRVGYGLIPIEEVIEIALAITGFLITLLRV